MSVRDVVQAAAGVGGDKLYVDDVFSTYIYTGTGGKVDITNGISLGGGNAGPSVDFTNPTNSYLSRTSDLANNTDSKTFTFSFWSYIPSSLGGQPARHVCYFGSEHFSVTLDVTRVLLSSKQASNSPALSFNTVTGDLPQDTWNHVVISVDLGNTGNRSVYINGVLASTSWNQYVNSEIDFTRNNIYVATNSATNFRGYLSNVFLDHTYRDMSQSSNQLLFRTSDGLPATGLASLNPVLYLPLDATNAIGKNLGTGGDFTTTGSPVASETFGPYSDSSLGEGGLVWLKSRSPAQAHGLFDTERANGTTKFLQSQATDAEVVDGGGSPIATVGIVPNSNGFTLNDNTYFNATVPSTYTYASWSWRKAPKFFDIVTWTGNSVSGRTIAHNLGTVPGMIIVKRTNSPANWAVYHRDLTNANHSLLLNLTAAQDESGYFGNTNPTDTVFSVNANSVVNGTGNNYVAYVFAHNAGGFGDDGDQNVISCGSVVGASQQEVYLGFEPQWILLKNRDSAQDWWMVDNMRGWPVQGTDTSYSARRLNANLSSAESTLSIAPSATGFKANTMSAGQTYIYMAIRRPMKPPEVGTEVYNAITRTGTGAVATVTGVGFPTDLVMIQPRNAAGNYPAFTDRLRGSSKVLVPSATTSESSSSATQDLTGWTMDGFTLGTGAQTSININNVTTVLQCLKRAPGFMDEVCYTGTGSGANTITHGLTVAPELLITKIRGGGTESGVGGWGVYAAPLTIAKVLELNATTASASDNWFSGNTGDEAAPTSTQFTVWGNDPHSNRANGNYAAYLFASLAGVSKIASYSGTGNFVNVDCGFAAGARFVMIKRTDSTGDWYVWDSARGIAAGNDPYLLLNSTAAEVTNTDYIDPLSSGFTVTSSAPAALNASGGSYLFLAIA